jgi:hypothetical protein
MVLEVWVIFLKKLTIFFNSKLFQNTLLALCEFKKKKDIIVPFQH